jgi:hypothetical protein
MVFFSFSTEGEGEGVHKILFLFPLALMAVLILFERKIYFDVKILPPVMLGLFIAIYNALITTSEFGFSLNIILSLVIAILFLSFAKAEPRIVCLVLRQYIYVNVFAILYQGFHVVFLGDALYLHGELFSFSRESYSLVESGGFFRLSGYQMEPGSCAVLLLTTILLLFLIEKKMTHVSWIALVASVLTFSTIGLILSLLAICVFYKEIIFTLHGMIKVAFLLAVLVAILSGFGVVEYVTERFSSPVMDNSSYYKFSNLISYVGSPIVDKIAGIGLGVLPDGCFTCGHITGNGSLFYAISGVGVFGYILYILPVYSAQDKVAFIFLLFIAASRYSVIYIQFWVIYLMLVRYCYVYKEK